MIPYGRQQITQTDIDAVTDVLRSDFLTTGPAVPMFEGALAEKTNAAHAIAVNSATSALHIACLALDLGPGDTLWTAPNTFVASANVGRLCGADVDFVDIDPATYCMSADALEAKLERGPAPKIVMPVHFAGQCGDMEQIAQLGKTYGFKIVEDASHAIGAQYKGSPIGSCQYSDVAVFSFHPVKIITTAEGGAAMTQDAALADKMRSLRSHGVTRSDALVEQNGPWYYAQDTLGLNYRITDIQAALGLSQLERLDAFIARRHDIRKRYDEALKGLPLILPAQNADCHSSLHLYPIQIDRNRTNKTRREVFEQLRDTGIGVQVHYIPVHTQPYYQALGFGDGDFPASEAYYAQAISIPMFADLSDAQVDEVVAKLKMCFD